MPKLKFEGAYFSQRRSALPYEFELEVPKEEKAAALSFFKTKLKDEGSSEYKEFISKYPDFERIYTHRIKE